MNKQDKKEPNTKQPVIEDLVINQTQAEEVKGGNRDLQQNPISWGLDRID
jgi:hypothetical protein